MKISELSGKGKKYASFAMLMSVLFMVGTLFGYFSLPPRTVFADRTITETSTIQASTVTVNQVTTSIYTQTQTRSTVTTSTVTSTVTQATTSVLTSTVSVTQSLPPTVFMSGNASSSEIGSSATTVKFIGKTTVAASVMNGRYGLNLPNMDTYRVEVDFNHPLAGVGSCVSGTVYMYQTNPTASYHASC